MKATLTRQDFSDVQTLGELEVFKNGAKVFECKTLELEVDSNQVRDDAIPYGTYTVKKRTSAKYKEHFHVQNVPNRSYILIHNGNYYTQILGCILVGRSHADINKDGYRDVTSSKDTLRKLYALMPDEFELEIKK